MTIHFKEPNWFLENSVFFSMDHYANYISRPIPAENRSPEVLKPGFSTNGTSAALFDLAGLNAPTTFYDSLKKIVPCVQRIECIG